MAVNLVKLKHKETGVTCSVPEHMVVNAEKVGFERVDSAPSPEPKPEAPSPESTRIWGEPDNVTRLETEPYENL